MIETKIPPIEEGESIEKHEFQIKQLRRPTIVLFNTSDSDGEWGSDHEKRGVIYAALRTANKKIEQVYDFYEEFKDSPTTENKERLRELIQIANDAKFNAERFVDLWTFLTDFSKEGVSEKIQLTLEDAKNIFKFFKDLAKILKPMEFATVVKTIGLIVLMSTTSLGSVACNKVVSALEETAKPTQVDTNTIQSENTNEVERSDQIKTIVSEIQASYGITIHTEPFHEMSAKYIDGVSADSLSNEELQRGLDILIETLSVYPKDFFRNNDISEISIVGNLKFYGAPHYGLAIQMGEKSTIFTSVLNNNERTPRTLLIRNFHHEIFHLIDDVIGVHDDWNDIQGCECNVYEVTSGSDHGHAFATTDIHSPLDSGIDLRSIGGGGYLYFEDIETGKQFEIPPSTYGLSHPKEDAAILASTLLTPELSGQYGEWIEDLYFDGNSEDQEVARVLIEKIRRVKEIYKEKSNGKMNDLYWRLLKENRVGEYLDQLE
jgi:hypothetical protein